MHEIQRYVLISLPRFFGIDFSITNEVVLLWISAFITFSLLAAACRRRDIVPRGMLQNIFEALIETIEKEIVKSGIGAEGRIWSPFLLSIFFFVLFCNLLGMVPIPSHVKAMTSNLTVTAALASLVFMVTIYANIRSNGVTGFLRKFVPANVHWWLAILVVPIEVITWLARPFSLAIRLFANMLVGHTLILVFIGLLSAAAVYLKPLPLAGAVAMSCFELFVCFIQAFIFAMLSGLYIRDALEKV